MNVMINGSPVPVTAQSTKIIEKYEIWAANPDTRGITGVVALKTIVDSVLFQQWLDTIDPSFNVSKIVIKGVTMFGPRPGFLFIEADVTDADGDRMPGAVFLRGDSVAILVELVAPSGRYAVLTRQARFPSGKFLLEIPAGMMDGDGNFKGKALDELTEEVPALAGKFSAEAVTALSDEPIYMSPGGCNERIGYYHLVIEVDDETIVDLIGTEGGEGDHEKITIAVAPWETLSEIPDAKLQTALGMYQPVRIAKLEAELALAKLNLELAGKDTP